MTEPVPSSDREPSFHLEEDSFEDQLPGVRDLIRSVLSRLPLFFGIVAVGLAIGLFLASAPRRYSSMATLRIEPSNASALEISPSQLLGGQSGSDEKINSEVDIMQSRTIYLKVAEELHLPTNPDFWGGRKVPAAVAADPNMKEPRTRDLVLTQLYKIVSVVRPLKTDIVHIVCTTPSPLLSAKIANSITNEYIARVFQVRYGSTERVSGWLVSQLTDLKNKVEQDQEQLVVLQGKLGVLGFDQKNSAYLLADSLEGVTKASSEATIGRIVAETKLRVLQGSDPNLIEGEQPLLQQPSPNSSGLLQTLRDSRAEAAASYANLSAKYGPAYPEVKQAKARVDELNSEVKQEEKRIVNQAKTSYDAAAANEKETSSVLNSLKNQAFSSRSDMVRYVILQRQYESDRLLYESLTERLRVAGINAGLESAQVDIIDLADVSSIAHKPLPWELFVLAFLASIPVGALAAILADQLNRRLGRPEDAEKLLGIPLLSALQRFTFGGQRGKFEELQSGPYAEGMQLLRGSVLMSRPGRAPRTLLITSAIPGEGKSTASRGIAAMLAMHDARVLLIDADLHRPVQAYQLDVTAPRGLSEVLSSDADPMEAIVPVPAVKGLFLLPAGRCPPQPANLLGSLKMAQVVDQVKKEFDFVVIDSPPVLRVSDTILLTPLVESIVLIVRQNLAEVKEVRQAIRMIKRGRGNIAGFAMNATTNIGSGYDSYYQNYGNYGAAEESGRKL